MRNTIMIFKFLLTVTVFGQSSTEFLESGILKHEKQDFKGAIKDYTKAIKADKKIKMHILIEERVN